MSKFIKRSLSFIVFLIILFAFSIIFLSINHSCFSKTYNLEPTTTGIFIGDSHVRSSLNDELIAKHVNMGLFAESYYFSYYKLELVFKKNPQIERLYLGLGYHNLSNYFDDYISGTYSKDISSNYFFILPFNEQLKNMYWNLDEFPSYMKLNLKKEFLNLFDKTKPKNKSGYINNHFIDSISIVSINKRIQAQFYTERAVKGFSKFNLVYLKKINDLCQQHDIELIFFNAPLHNYYKNNIPKEYLKKHRELIKQYGHKFIDFSSIFMEDDCYRKDGDHLTKKGALLLTHYFNDYLKSEH